MRATITAILLIVALAGCATTYKPTPGNNDTSQIAFDQAKYACEMEVRQAAQGRRVVGGLLFIAIVVAANAAADHATYKNCMAARGYTAVKD